ncbi:Transcriptional regulator [Seminavis robusta]|uniref:Transcriptional regulator n=1 Tax=Seminavis robusta TaxID=568900 RepID=A0A9N8E076_9STRA|nr:Transcriptional regulator [Seminavis robusta]|eukprot:Sro489_g153290.1 Transcriptional regulator (281) ;mRNA; f:33100-34364
MMHQDNYNHLPYERLAWQSPNSTMAMPVSSKASDRTADTGGWSMTGIAYPGKHDVMLGRGGESNYHAGNLTFRSFIQEHKIRYQKARKQEKPIIALEVVLAWRELSPPGRFLARVDPSRADSLWEDVGDEQACKRAGRTLGEKSSNKTSPKRKHSSKSSDAEQTKDKGVASIEPVPSRPKTPQEGQSVNILSSNSVEEEGRPNKKRKLRAPSPDTTASGASMYSDKSSPIVTPDNTVTLVEESRAMAFLDTPMYTAKPRSQQLMDDLPTAEFLTQTVVFD